MRATKHSDGKIEISGFGLKIELESSQIYKDLIKQESQTMLDEMIEEKYKFLLSKLWVDTLSYLDADSIKKLGEKWKESVTANPDVFNIACFVRDILLKLHSDSEMIGDLNPEQEYTREFAHSVWKYSETYGFNSGKSVSF